MVWAAIHCESHVDCLWFGVVRSEFNYGSHFVQIQKAEDDLAKQTQTIMRVQEQFNEFQCQQQRE